MVRVQRGFTLVELITVIVILGMVSVGIATFMRNSMDIYASVSEREQLLIESRFAIERMTRELRRAAPHSVRIKGSANQHCLEFVPVNFAGRYTDLPLKRSKREPLTMLFPADADGTPYLLEANEYALINPESSKEVYNEAHKKLRKILSCTDDGDGDCTTLDSSDGLAQLSVDGYFDAESAQARVYLVNKSINYCVRNGVLHRSTNDIVVNQSFASADLPRLAVDVVNALSGGPKNSPKPDTPFWLHTSDDATVVQLRLRFARGDEQISFNQEVQLVHQP